MKEYELRVFLSDFNGRVTRHLYSSFGVGLIGSFCSRKSATLLFFVGRVLRPRSPFAVETVELPAAGFFSALESFLFFVFGLGFGFGKRVDERRAPSAVICCALLWRMSRNRWLGEPEFHRADIDRSESRSKRCDQLVHGIDLDSASISVETIRFRLSQMTRSIMKQALSGLARRSFADHLWTSRRLVGGWCCFPFSNAPEVSRGRSILAARYAHWPPFHSTEWRRRATSHQRSRKLFSPTKKKSSSNTSGIPRNQILEPSHCCWRCLIFIFFQKRKWRLPNLHRFIRRSSTFQEQPRFEAR